MQPVRRDRHMQGLDADAVGAAFGQYLDLGPDIHATGRALQVWDSGADGRQRKAPVIALLGAPKVNHQAAAGVG